MTNNHTSVLVVSRIVRASVLFALLAVTLSCASGPRPYGNRRGTLRLMFDRDVAQILLAHCDAGIEVSRAVASAKVSSRIVALAETVRRNKESDRAAITAWIASQSSSPSAVGTTEEARIRGEHSKVVEQLAETQGDALDVYALRVISSHYDEELEFIETTPVKDEQLRRIVEAIWRRLSSEVKELSRRVPGQPPRPEPED